MCIRDRAQAGHAFRNADLEGQPLSVFSTSQSCQKGSSGLKLENGHVYVTLCVPDHALAGPVRPPRPSWLYMAFTDLYDMYGSVRLYMAPYCSTWLYMTLYGSIWLCMALYGSIWLYLALCGSALLYMAYCSIWLFLALYDSIWLWMALHRSICFYLTLSGS